MFDPHRTDTSRAVDAVSDPDRDAKVEQLLLDGLDCYFAAQYDQAINVWSRALFFDRGHARARAYIDRARRALAERQRESEELVGEGIAAALRRGQHQEARRLLEDAVGHGAQSDQVHAAAERLDRIDQGIAQPTAVETAGAGRRDGRPQRFRSKAHSLGRWTLLMTTAIVVAGSVWLLISSEDIRQLFRDTADASATPVSLPPVDVAPSLPLRAETALTRARMLAAGGRLHDAMAALDLVRPTDPQKGEADRLRAELQRRLISLTLPDDSVPADRGAAGDSAR